MKNQEQKTERMIFRLTKIDKEKIEKKMAKSKLKKSDYIRKSLLGKEIIQADGLTELAKEISKIGINLNQLVKLENQKKKTIFSRNKIKVEDLKKSYDEVFEETLKLLKRVNK